MGKAVAFQYQLLRHSSEPAMNIAEGTSFAGKNHVGYAGHTAKSPKRRIEEYSQRGMQQPAYPTGAGLWCLLAAA